MKRLVCSLVFCLVGIISSAHAQLLFFDDFSQFPNGTVITGDTNYTPEVWSLPGTQAEIWTNTPGYGTVSASNLLSSVRLFFDAQKNPGGDNAGYEAQLRSWDNNGPVTTYVTNGVMDVQWLSWIAATKSLTATGGLSVSIATTNLDIWCDDGSGYCETNLNTNPLLFFADGGLIYAFTNNPNNGIGPLPLVQLGSWSSLKGTVMTNRLVLNYPIRRFSLSLNGTVITNNMIITSYFTNLFTGADFGCAEMLPSSAGNKFALDNVQILVSNGNLDVTYYLAGAKGMSYLQTNDGAPSLQADNPYGFHAEVVAVDSNTVLGATLHPPTGSKQLLAQDSFDPAFWELANNTEFASQVDLDAVYTNGTYRLSILGLNQGLRNPALSVTGNTYPSIPRISNWGSIQAVDATKDFSLQWFSSGGNASDFILVNLSAQDGTTAFDTSSQTNFSTLNGTFTSVVIPANTLQPGNTYDGNLIFITTTARDTTSIPGALGLAGYYKQTAFTLITSGVETSVDLVVSQTASANPVTVGDSFTFTITLSNRGPDTATGIIGTANVSSNLTVTGVTGCDPSSPPGQCNLGSLASGASTTVVLTVSATAAGQGCNTGSAYAVETELNPANNTSTLCVTVNPANAAPTIGCPDPITTNNAVGQCGRSLAFNVTATGWPTPTLTRKVGSTVITSPYTFPVGTTTVDCTASNDVSTDSCSFTVTVNDTEPPTITCGVTGVVSNVPFGQTSAIVTYPAPVVSDNCSVVTFTNCTPASGTTFDLGTNQVTCIAVDSAGNTNSCLFNVIVTETSAQADLAVAGVSLVSTAVLNNTFGYSFVVTNKGPQDATDAKFEVVLPTNVVSYGSSISTLGPCVFADGKVTCDFDTLTSGSAGTVSLVVTATAPAQICITGTVSSAVADSVAVNNSAAVCVPVVVNDLAVTAFKAPKRVILSARRTNVTSRLFVTIQNRGNHTETIQDLSVLSNLVTVAVAAVGTSNECSAPVAQLLPRALPLKLRSGRILKLAYKMTFTCATDPARTTRTANHNDYQYLVTVHHEALDGTLDSHSADDACPHNALGRDPVNRKIRDRGCGLRQSPGVFIPVVTDIIDTRP